MSYSLTLPLNVAAIVFKHILSCRNPEYRQKQIPAYKVILLYKLRHIKKKVYELDDITC